MLLFLRDTGKGFAFLVHFGISAAVVGAVGLGMFLAWYPPPWFAHDGGWQVLRIIIFVDVVLGPLLTLVVFRRGKPGLRRDLAVIGGLQLAALLYGGGVMFLYRPAFVVYAESNFFTAPWADVKAATRDLERIEQLRLARGPALVYLHLPDDPAERARLRRAAGRGGPPLTVLGDHYEGLSSARWQEIFARTIPIETLARENPEVARDLARFLDEHPFRVEQLAFVPVTCRYGIIMLVFDRGTKEVVGWMT